MNKNGFTLIEVLISTTILVFIITGMTIALMQQQRQFNFIKEAVDIDQTGKSVLDFLTSEIRNSAARQGKHFSLNFVNGGELSCDTANQTTDFGSVDSPPDCLEIFTWDITRGMNDTFADPTSVRLPSIASSVIVNNNQTGSFAIDVPLLWFDGTNFIGEESANPTVLLGFRSRTNLCSPNETISCLTTPEFCSECSMIIEGEINSVNNTFVFNDSDKVKYTNFPKTLNFTSVDDYVNGLTLNGLTYGLINTITSQASEMTIVQSKAFRVDPVNRELQMSFNGDDFEPIAGGQKETEDGLEAPGIADLQFVFNLQNADGSLSKVGHCDGTTCNDTGKNIFSDFNQNQILGREHDIRSIEIFLVIKSKSKPAKLRGGLHDQDIPEIADVLERDSGSNQSTFKEPEEGFIYRVHSTTVYPRNMSREDFG